MPPWVIPVLAGAFGPILLLIGAIMGPGAGFRFFAEPRAERKRLRKVMATGLWLSCYELRRHLESIKVSINEDGAAAIKTRNALMKLPSEDWNKQLDWFVKSGYFSMITAYRIAAFSSWMRIYQSVVLRALMEKKSTTYTSQLFQKYDAYKVAASLNTVLWYNYIDAIGERLIVQDGELSRPIYFSEFCRQYSEDPQFLAFFDQLHMFIHFLGSLKQPWPEVSSAALANMVNNLLSLEQFLAASGDSLLGDFEPKPRDRIKAAQLGDVVP